MRCLNCGTEIVLSEMTCANCSAKISLPKYNFISYIGPSDSLYGYQKSYKLVLLKCIIDAILDKGEARVSDVISEVKNYYLGRQQQCLKPDFDVDIRIAQIEKSSDYDVFSVMKSQPFKVMNDKGYLFINRNSDDKLLFAFHEDIDLAMSKDEWKKLLSIIEQKLSLYYRDHNGNNILTEELKMKEKENSVLAIEHVSSESIKPLDPRISVLDIVNLSVRAKNVLMRNALFTVGDLFEFAKNNDLLSLKNIGKKTCEEIFNLLESNNALVADTNAPDSIASLFSENRYRLFVKYCIQNDIVSLSDLQGFDFSVLLSEPGFGVGKLEAIKSRYNYLIENYNLKSSNVTVALNNLESAESVNGTPVLSVISNIDDSNKNLDISFLKYADISSKDISRFREQGFYKIRQIHKFTLKKALQMFGQDKSITIIDKLKIFEKPLSQIALEFLDKNRDTREFNILIDRANKKTLQEIADHYGLTRERVRQMESKASNLLLPLLNSLIENHMISNSLSYISTQDVLDFFDNDDYTTLIIHTLKEAPSLEFLDFADLFIKKVTPNQNTFDILYKLTENLIGEGIYFFDCLPQIEEMLNNAGLDYISLDAYLNYLIESNAQFYGDFVALKKLPYVKLCLILINKYFKDGILLNSDKDINLLRSHFYKEFGDYNLPERNRAISARLSDNLILCDRGKAKTIENIRYDQSVIEEIKAYIDNSELKKLYFSEIFNEFEGLLAFTSDINNYYGLHGILAYLYRDEYEFSRDCITKKNCTEKALSLSERIIKFILGKGCAVRKAEIRQQIGGISDIMLFNAISNSVDILQWDFNSFNALANLNISKEDTLQLQMMLEEAFSLFAGYCSDRLIFEKVRAEFPEFISKNQIENATNLFYVLQNCFCDKYEFSRPHICQKEIVHPLTTKNIALYLLGATRTINRSAFIKVAKRVCWSETTANAIFSELEEDYVRISEDTYILLEDFRIDETALNILEKFLEAYIVENDYLSMIGFSDFETFPSIQYEWNSFLLISIIKKYGLGVKLVSPAIKDRRYNKEIIVSERSDYNHLDDIVYSLLVKNNSTTIDESSLLSFLVINHLVSKIIPKELYDSKKLNYSDGYFNIL